LLTGVVLLARAHQNAGPPVASGAINVEFSAGTDVQHIGPRSGGTSRSSRSVAPPELRRSSGPAGACLTVGEIDNLTALTKRRPWLVQSTRTACGCPREVLIPPGEIAARASIQESTEPVQGVADRPQVTAALRHEGATRWLVTVTVGRGRQAGFRVHLAGRRRGHRSGEPAKKGCCPNGRDLSAFIQGRNRSVRTTADRLHPAAGTAARPPRSPAFRWQATVRPQIGIAVDGRIQPSPLKDLDQTPGCWRSERRPDVSPSASSTKLDPGRS